MSRLLDSSKEIREKLIAKNIYNENDVYSESHANALSDGDKHGRGEVDGVIGTIDDINKRNELLSKNKFNKNKEYGQTGTV